MKNLVITEFPKLNYACSEAVNTLCTNLSFSGENVHKIMLTSCHASEGKSFVSMNIMRTLANLGKRVALVDADMRRSELAAQYGFQYETEEVTGLAHYLAGMATVDDVLHVTNINGAYIVPAGKNVINSLQLLVSPRFKQLMDTLAEQMDYVIVDAPPLGAIIDAAEITKSCDGSLIVVNFNEVRRQELMEVKAQLEQTGCPILGMDGVEALF